MVVESKPNAPETKKMERQPRYCVKSPPAKGPKASPKYTADTDMPNTRPRNWGKKADTRMAGPVVLVKAAPMPWMYLKTISQFPEPEKPHISDEMVKTTTPVLKMRLMPV